MAVAQDTLDACLAFVLAAEGGYVNDPRDPGRATNFGITLAELAQWRDAPVRIGDVQALGVDEARAIYVARYWNVLRGPALPRGIDLMMLDAGVNLGPERAACMLQSLAGCVADGVIGPITLAALAGLLGRAGLAAVIDQLADARVAFYRTLPDFGYFGAGWLNRVAAARSRANALALPSPAMA